MSQKLSPSEKYSSNFVIQESSFYDLGFFKITFDEFRTGACNSGSARRHVDQGSECPPACHAETHEKQKRVCCTAYKVNIHVHCTHMYIVQCNAF